RKGTSRLTGEQVRVCFGESFARPGQLGLHTRVSRSSRALGQSFQIPTIGNRGQRKRRGHSRRHGADIRSKKTLQQGVKAGPSPLEAQRAPIEQGSRLRARKPGGTTGLATHAAIVLAVPIE